MLLLAGASGRAPAAAQGGRPGARAAPPAAAPALRDPRLRFSALAELAGDSMATAFLLHGSAPPELVRRTVLRLAAEAEAAAAAGRPLDAARRWELLAADLSSPAVAGPQPWARAAEEDVRRYLRAGAAAYEAAGDSVRAGRLLRRLALEERESFDVLLASVNRSVRAATAERVAVMLIVEHVFRASGQGEVADSMLVMTCTAFCGEATDDPEALAAALREERGERPGRPYYRRGPVQEGVRTLLAHAARDHLSPREQTAMALWTDFEVGFDAAVDSLRAGGRHARVADLFHSRAYLLLPKSQFFGAHADARAALGHVRLALEARRAAGDRAAEARSLALGALAMLRMGAPDSARAMLAAAEPGAQGAPAPLRPQLRRRAAIIAAVTGDAAGAERLVAEAAGLRRAGDDAWDRYIVARELVTAGAGPAALRQARLAYPVLRDLGWGEWSGRGAAVLAQAHHLTGSPDSAVHYFRLAAGELQRAGMDDAAALVRAALAEVELERGRLEDAEAELGRAAAAARRGLRAFPGAEARILNDEGLVRFGGGEWAAAHALFTAAGATATPVSSEYYEARNHLALARVAMTPPERLTDEMLEELGRTLSERVTPATEQVEPGRAAARPLTRGWMQTYSALANVYRGNLSEAHTALDQALPLLREAGHEPSLRRARGVLGMLFARLGRADSASVYLRLAGDMAPSGAAESLVSGGRTPRDVARSRPPAEALPALRRMRAERRAANDALGEAQVLEALGWLHFRGRRPADPAAATAYYDSAAALMRSVSQWRLSDWQRVQLAEQHTRMQEESTLAWLARSGEIGAPAAAAAALAAADRGRGRAFELLERGAPSTQLSGEIRHAAVWSRPLPEVGVDLLDGPIGTYVPSGACTAVLSYLHAQDTLVTWISTVAGAGKPALRALRRPLASDTLGALVARARGGMETGGREPGGLEPRPGTDGARGLGVGPGDIREALRALAVLLLPDELVRPAPRQGCELLVVAGGALASVPFAALPVDTAGTPLSEHRSIRYVPSHGTEELRDGLGRMELPGRDSAAARRAWLSRAVVVGNPRMPAVRHADGEVRPLTPLPGAEREARAVAGRLAAAPLIGEDATLQALRSRASRATLVHLATHGYAFATEDRVGDSFVALAPTADDDGLLTVSELVADSTLSLSAAELVVLSACQTALGQTTASEGTLGLQRAFLAAGARSVLVSLWNVSDDATALLLDAFYRHWLDDADSPSKAEALRRAQLEVRRVSGYEHPRYWAAFQLVGAP